MNRILLAILFQVLYAFENPYRMCRKEFAKRGEKDVHMYGETPFAVWKSIMILAQLQKSDVFLDLGCGRGRLCFWAKFFVGCRTIGVDWVETFVKRANFLSRLFALRGMTFYTSGIKDFSLKQATVVYLYTYHEDEESLDFSELAEGSRVISVSEPLQQRGFFVKTSKILAFPWGECEVFVNVYTAPCPKL